MAVSVHFALAPPPKNGSAKPRVAVRVAARPATAPPPAVAPAVAPPRFPLPTDKPIAKKTPPPKPAVAPPAPSPMEPAPEQVIAMPSAALTQPALVAPPAPPSAGLPQIGLPAIGASIALPDAPPGPSDIPPFQSALSEFERPGGTVTVFAVLVNDAGIAVDSLLVVPSKWPLIDMTLVFSQKGKQWTQLDPPMLPGEYRWLELRIDTAAEQSRNATLP